MAGFTYDQIYCLSGPFPHMRLIKLIYIVLIFLSGLISLQFRILLFPSLTAHIFQIWLRRDVWSLAYNQVQLPMFKLLNIFFLLFMETKSSKEYSVAAHVFQIWLRHDVWSLAYNQVQIHMLKLLSIFFFLFMETKSSKEYSVAISVEKRKL